LEREGGPTPTSILQLDSGYTLETRLRLYLGEGGGPTPTSILQLDSGYTLEREGGTNPNQYITARLRL